ncbi:MAG TPA: hypothetical protein PKD25_03850 [Rubrivivax sp.]|nr:hypothetical protein [Rubrivivax sp.]
MLLRGMLLALACALAGWAVVARAGGIMVPSAWPVLVTALAALLAPLLWPGTASSSAGSVRRVLAWSAGCAAAVAGVLLLAAPAALPAPRSLAVAGMLGAMLVATHAAAALLERVFGGTPTARTAIAGGAVTLMLALVAALPLWLGPFAQLASAQHPWADDAAVAISPLMHLAAAAGNDLPRNDWFYAHSALASMQFDDLDPAWLAAAWLAVAVVLLAFVARPRRDTSPFVLPEEEPRR